MILHEHWHQQGGCAAIVDKQQVRHEALCTTIAEPLSHQACKARDQQSKST
jgi:hypothetical protein